MIRIPGGRTVIRPVDIAVSLSSDDSSNQSKDLFNPLPARSLSYVDKLIYGNDFEDKVMTTSARKFIIMIRNSSLPGGDQQINKISQNKSWTA